jgi:amino-acid N-acetyltransferase
MTKLSIEPARREELSRIFELRQESDPPPDGFEDHLLTNLFARHEDQVVGSAALELYGSAALLRSVAVSWSLRGSGIGYRLTEAALELSRDYGIEEVYLLTETADLFFPRFGFRQIPRSEVPHNVQSSIEFTSACPASAMVLDLRAV